MEATNWERDKMEEIAVDFKSSGTSCGCENVKTMIADKLHKVAETLGEKSTDQDAQSGTAQYKQQASEWLEQSAEYVRQFDYKQTDAKVRDYVRQRPGKFTTHSRACVPGLLVSA